MVGKDEIAYCGEAALLSAWSAPPQVGRDCFVSFQLPRNDDWWVKSRYTNPPQSSFRKGGG